MGCSRHTPADDRLELDHMHSITVGDLKEESLLLLSAGRMMPRKDVQDLKHDLSEL